MNILVKVHVFEVALHLGLKDKNCISYMLNTCGNPEYKIRGNHGETVARGEIVERGYIGWLVHSIQELNVLRARLARHGIDKIVTIEYIR